jgi:hypothetical protein
MQLNRTQLELVSKYLSDVSKILVASTVIGFFVPASNAPVTLPIFLLGSFAAGITFWGGVHLGK